jgi:hypothetical protein
VDLAKLGSESETCVGSRVHLVGVSISFEKNFYRLPFTPPLFGSPYRSFTSAGVALSAGTPRRVSSPVKQAVEMPIQMSKTQERPMSSTDTMGDLGSHKRVKKGPHKPCKPGLRLATK